MSFQLQRLVRSGVSFVVMALLVLATSAVVAFAQTETGQVLVRATDPNGAIVPGAAITLTSTDRGDVKTATTGDNGEAQFTNLQPGNYSVSVKAGSFAEFVQPVQVTVGSKLTVEAKLGTQQISGGTVTFVGGSGVEVNTQTQELSTVVSGTQIRELPTITRNPYALAAIAGNVSDVNNADAQSGATARGVGVAINGQRAASTNILLDGGENVDTFTAGVGQSVPLDSVGEFRIITSNFSAEYGRATGGIVNVATRAGTNE
ncbi:MAG TPA: carboxypeptidase-like regulatory domain-containing protein, partial [Pyrinomonadaceae bacterium]|nr:carboxypeptidase-like regulatory domain-containing protein [Pyrinomonadaceae bacterium]